MQDRNNEITRRVLRGETMTSLAKEVGVTPTRIRQIVAKTCRRKNRKWFEAMPGGGLDLRWVREHKRVFFEDV